MSVKLPFSHVAIAHSHLQRLNSGMPLGTGRCE